MSVCVRTKYTHIATGSIICAPILQNEQQHIPLSVLSHTFGVCVSYIIIRICTVSAGDGTHCMLEYMHAMYR